MVGKSSRLCLLQMGKSRHIGFQIILHKMKQCRKQLLQFFLDCKHLSSYIKLHVKSHLIISASSGVHFLAGVSDSVDQRCLHKAVHIFILCGYVKSTCLHLFPDLCQSFYNRILFLAGQNPLLFKHDHMGNAAFDILL